jgi:hypothetical protein
MDEAFSDQRELRAARNEALFRLLNQRVEKLNDAFELLLEDMAITCECSDSACIQLLWVEPHVYQHVRANPGRFVVAVGHVDAALECAVAETAGYVIVENTAAAARLPEASDLRSDAAPAD